MAVRKEGLSIRSHLQAGALQENLQAWMADRRGRDQFAARWGDETEIFWNDAARGLAEQARWLCTAISTFGDVQCSQLQCLFRSHGTMC